MSESFLERVAFGTKSLQGGFLLGRADFGRSVRGVRRDLLLERGEARSLDDELSFESGEAVSLVLTHPLSGCRFGLLHACLLTLLCEFSTACFEVGAKALALFVRLLEFLVHGSKLLLQVVGLRAKGLGLVLQVVGSLAAGRRPLHQHLCSLPFIVYHSHRGVHEGSRVGDVCGE